MSYENQKKGVMKYLLSGAIVGGAIVGLADHYRNTSYAEDGSKLTRMRGKDLENLVQAQNYLFPQHFFNGEGTVSLMSHHGYYLVAESDGSLNANRDQALEWETWTPEIHGQDTVAMRSWHGKYMVCEGDGGANANRDVALGWEEWEIWYNECPDYRNDWECVSLRSHAHGKWLCAEGDNTVNCNRDAALEWETWHGMN